MHNRNEHNLAAISPIEYPHSNQIGIPSSINNIDQASVEIPSKFQINESKFLPESNLSHVIKFKKGLEGQPWQQS